MLPRLNAFTNKIFSRFTYSCLKQLHTKNDFPHLAIFSNDGLGRKVITEGWAEKYFLEQLAINIFPKITKNSIALDLGANIGNHSLWFAKYFDQVHSFEPNKRPFHLLQANAMLTSNIIVHNYGCSNKQALNQSASIPKKNIGGARLHSPTPNPALLTDVDLVETTFFNLIKLDDFIPQESHNRIGFIKCDVEGHEEKALQGAEKIILASKPVIAFEINDFVGVWDYLRNLGYSNFYGVAKFRGLKTIEVLPKILNLIPISNENYTQVYREGVFFLLR